VITGLAFGITIATVFAPNLIDLGGSVFAAAEAWRMPFLFLGAATLVVGVATATYFRRQESGLPYARATLHLMGFSAIGLAAVLAVYFVGDAAGLSDLWIAILEVCLALALVGFVFTRRNSGVGVVLKSRDLVLINIALGAIPALPVRARGDAPGDGRWDRRKVPAVPVRVYGVVVDRVNVSVLLYEPVRSGSLAPIACLNSIGT
jgi:hypothetical protein